MEEFRWLVMAQHLRNDCLIHHLFLGGKYKKHSQNLSALISVVSCVFAMIRFMPFHEFLIFP